MDKIPVAVLGATGLVGQRFISILSNHPWFKIEYLGASERSKGMRYGDAVTWVISDSPPNEVAEMVVGGVREVPRNIEIVFSALPSDVAKDVEVDLAKRGFVVVSNASPLRLEKDIPLLNPEVNYEHIRLLSKQKRLRGWAGAILKNPNCTTAILTLSLAPIYEEFGLDELLVTTMQSISGAGLKGVPGYVITDNIVPYISKEEFKVTHETRKILGRYENGEVKPLDLNIAVTTTRVPVLDGHLEVVYAKLRKQSDVQSVIDVMSKFKSLPQELKLPTAPRKPIIVRKEADRPQPRLDRLAGNGMSVSVGRVDIMNHLSSDWLRYVVLGHNTIRGAAGAAVLIAELYVKLFTGYK